jgi:hypothetical protein
MDNHAQMHSWNIIVNVVTVWKHLYTHQNCPSSAVRIKN